MRRPPDPCVISGLRAEESSGLFRVTAEVDGAPVWFETRDVALEASPEGLASAFVIPAAASGRGLSTPFPLDALWRTNAARAAALLRGWWGYDAPAPEAPQAAPAASAASGTALFFSGGIDSFDALLGAPMPPDLLVTVAGFDYPAHDEARGRAVEASLREVAAAVGAKPVYLRTNVREHPTLRPVSWDRTHGGVLAAVGHLLAQHAGRIHVPASLPGDQDIPWGSHWRLDPFWSSSRVTIGHLGVGRTRAEKFRAWAAHPLVHRHLRVCWRNTSPTGNCAACAKCLLAMFAMEVCGELERCAVFPQPPDLAGRIDRLRRTPDRIHTFEQLLEGADVDPDLRRAVRALIRRSRRDMGRYVQTRRRMVGWVFGLFGRGRP